VYTRTGDRGETRLAGGKKIAKDAQRIETYGTIDELNSILGLARSFNEAEMSRSPASKRLDAILKQIQNELFDIGGQLATPPENIRGKVGPVGAREVAALEQCMDECLKDLEPLKSFILPGGGRVAAFLHQARTVCRRAERELVRLSRDEPVGEWPRKYLNRVGDLFFVLARWIGLHLEEPEILWEPKQPGSTAKMSKGGRGGSAVQRRKSSVRKHPSSKKKRS
jgi:cob(I)alamin adenosyltransferase